MSRASVRVDGEVTGRIGGGLLVLVGVAPSDGEEQVRWMTQKLAHLRIFADEAGKMNLSLLDTTREVLVVSQFTLYGDCRKGRRPSFKGAALPTLAEPLYESFCEALSGLDLKVERGRFGADMAVELLNDGPVTLVLDSSE